VKAVSRAAYWRWPNAQSAEPAGWRFAAGLHGGAYPWNRIVMSDSIASAAR
jgi:hypothetical protein